MPIIFAPNNNEGSKALFTGRRNDLETIINLILSGNCVALYGERRSGKTLALQMLQMIINGDINSIINSLIDHDLLDTIPVWQKKLTKFKAIYISLHGIRTEAELVENLINCIKPSRICSNSVILSVKSKASSPSIPVRLRELLDLVQADCLSNSYKIVVLIDEMEILEEFENRGSVIAELFCDRRRYSEICFIHTGSYQWNNRVSSPGSLFTHLEPYYLGSMEVSATKNYLLSNFCDEMKDFIIVMGGAKPLYTQYICKYLFENNRTIPGDELCTELLENVSLCRQIEQNIFNEVRLDEESKKILRALAHHKNATSGWIAEKLRLSRTDTLNRLKTLSRFGSIVEEKGKYKIIGNIVEAYGKRICEDPSREAYQQPAIPITKLIWRYFRWAIMFGIIVFSFIVFNYYNPGTKLEEFQLSNLTFIVEVPNSMETNQKGELKVIVRANSEVKNLLIVFNSSYIGYNKDGESGIRISDIENGVPINSEIEYYVLPGESKYLSTIVSIPGGYSHEISVPRRPFPLQRLSLWISAMLGLIAAIIPGKEWIAIISFLKTWIINKDKTSI